MSASTITKYNILINQHNNIIFITISQSRCDEYLEELALSTLLPANNICISFANCTFKKIINLRSSSRLVLNVYKSHSDLWWLHEETTTTTTTSV